MMKKIFALVLMLVLGKISYSQYPLQQNLGSDSTIVISKGALQSRLINVTYTDTAAANLQRIRQYPAALIATTTGGLNLWVRNATATGWLPVATGSGNNIYTINGTLLGNRTLTGGGYPLTFTGLDKFVVSADSIRFTTGDLKFGLNTDSASLTKKISYSGNYRGDYKQFTLVDKGYVDSVVASSPAGTVTSIATNNGSGITGGTITSSGTLAIDTTNVISTKANVTSGLAGKLNISDTASMLGNYINNVGYGLSKAGQVVLTDSATLSAYYLRRKDSLTTTNPLGYVTKKILADTAAAIRSSSSSGFVPYTGATQNVDLGQFGLKTKYVEFDTSSQAVTDRRLQWSNDEGTLQFGMTNGATITQRLGLEQFARVKNVQGSQINKGQAVYIYGASGDRASVKLADNRDDSTSSKTLGVAAEDIPINGVGLVGTFGQVGNLNLSAFSPGNILYLDSVPGQLTATKPQAPYNLVFIGVVERANSGNGLLFVNPQNGYELEELHNVRITSPVRNNAILVYDSTRRLWVDTTVAQAGIAVTQVNTNAATGITGGPITTTGTISADTLLLSTRAWRQKGIDSVAALANTKIGGSLISGYLTKATGTSTIDTSQIYQSNGLVGIGTTSPARKLDVNGDALINGLTIGRGNYNYLLNVAVGYAALSSNSSGAQVTAIGAGALQSNTSGSYNTALGYNSLYANTSGQYNTALGFYALNSNSSGSNNTAIGRGALESNTSSENVAIGSETSKFNTTGTKNVAIGNAANAYITTGSNNTALGHQAGRDPVNIGQYNQTPSNSLYLGYQTRAGGNGNNTNEIVIGASTDGNGSNSVTLGNTSITKTVLRENVGIGTTAPDSALTVVNGAYFQRGVRMSGLPAAPGTKALRIDASGTLSYADTLIDAGGTVTSVATNTGTGITGGTITTSGTIAADTLLLSTRAWRQKGIDSVAALINNNISGTTNFIPRFSSANVLGNSIIQQSGTSIGINTSPSYTLDILETGSANIGAGTANNKIVITGNDNGGSIATTNTTYINFAPFQVEAMRITSGGVVNMGANFANNFNKLNVGGSATIGYTTNVVGPTDGLSVNGSVGIGLNGASTDSALSVLNGVRFQRGVRMSGLPSAVGTKTLRIDASGTLSIADTLTNGISGSGTNNYITKFTGSGSVGNSSAQDNGTTFDVAIKGKFTGTSGSDILTLSAPTNGGKLTFAVGSSTTGSLGSALALFGSGVATDLGITAESSSKLFLGANNQIRATITAGGNFGIGTQSPDSMLTVTEGAYLQRGVRLSGLPTAPGTRSVRIDANGTLSVSDTLTNGISGSGTTNYIPKFTGTSTIGNSSIFDNGSFVGIGRTTNASAGWNLAVQNGLTVTQGTTETQLFGYFGDAGVGTYSNHNFKIRVNNTDRATFDTSGNLGLGVTPSAWISYQKSLDFGGGGNYGGLSSRAEYVSLSNNAYLNTSDSWTYKNTATAAEFVLTGNQFQWRQAASGTANTAISFTQAMTLDASGNLLIGTTTLRNRLTLRASDAPTSPTLGTASGHAIFGNGASNVDYGLMIGVNGDGNSWLQSQRVDGTATAYNILLNPSGGNVGIGTTSPNTPLSIVANHISGQSILKIQPTTAYASGGLSSIGFNNSNGTRMGLIYHDATGLQLETGTALPILFNLNGNLRMTLDASGNLGLGVSPSNAYSDSRAFEIGASGILWTEATPSVYNSLGIGVNFYYDAAGNVKYKNTGVNATRYSQYYGQHQWYTAPSGTAGNAISFTQAMTLDASGRLAVGTSTFPTQNSGSLAGTAIFNGIVRISGSSSRYFTSGNGLELAVGSIYSYNRDLGAYNDLGINDAMTVKGAGNVGIGTSNPAQRLTILDANDAEGLGVYRAFSSASDAGTFIRLGALNGSSVPTAGAAIFGALEAGKTSGYLTFLTYTSSTASERMRITSGGNVGIGTISPDTKLQVQDGFISTYHNANVNDAGYGVEFYTNGGGSRNTIAAIYPSQVGTSRSGNLYFLTSNGGAPTEKMRITSGGNVGINIQIPTTTLDVGGLVRSFVSGGSTRFISTDGTVEARFGTFTTPLGYVGTESNHPFAIYSNGTERMRITAGGEVYIGNNPADQGAYNLQVNGTGVWGAGAYVDGSDSAVKKNIQPLGSSLDLIKQMNPVTFEYQPFYSKDTTTQTGFIAQELQQVLSDKVYKNGIVKEGGQYLGVAYQHLIPLLVKSIQELEAQVQALKSQLNNR